MKEGVELQNQEPINDQDTRVRQIMVKMAACALERNRVFKTPLPDISGVEEEMADRVALQEANGK